MAARGGARGLGACRRSQSAMEYLMTYGWAILVIAVILGVLFEIGVFSPYSNIPKALPGACQVSRPNGPGTVSYMGLTGVCNSAIPQSVASGSGSGSIFVSLGGTKTFTQGTAVGWIYNKPPLSGQSGDAILNGGLYLPRSSTSFGATFDPCSFYYVSSGANIGCSSYGTVSGLKYNTWYMIAQTFDSNGNVITYVYAPGSGTPTTGTWVAGQAIKMVQSGLYIGSWGSSSTYLLNGSLANVQFYNVALSQNSITTLYKRGIGAVPQDIVHLVGWWPLNGNAKDYSGNGYDGSASGIVYSTNWYGSYTAP